MTTRSSTNASGLSPKYAVMGFLYLRPMHGYELHKSLETSLREVWRISQSQAYNILKNLEKDHRISVTLQPQAKRPDKELLTLTELGKGEFEAWLYRPTPGSARAIRVEFLTRLFFAQKINSDLLLRLIQEQAGSIRANLIDLHARLDAVPSEQIFNRMGLDLRIRQLETIRDWVERSAQSFIEE